MRKSRPWRKRASRLVKIAMLSLIACATTSICKRLSLARDMAVSTMTGDCLLTGVTGFSLLSHHPGRLVCLHPALWCDLALTCSVIHHFSCRSLSIGTWRRVGQNSMDLIVFYSPDKACLTYYINNDAAGYKIEFPFSSIKNIELETLDVPVNAAGQRQGQLVITLTQPPNFYMDSSGSGGFIQCGDFTEDQQADQVLTHYLGGEAKKLSGELAKLVTLQSFAGRHMHAQMPIGMPMYPSIPEHAQHAQQIPHIVRPASSNAVYHHEAPPTQQFHRRHQRTRSRSVPIAIDFSQLQQNMPSFSFQEPHGGDHLYAPAPQHPHQLAQAVSMDNPLRIDTSNNFLDYRPGSTYPVSATTASPSDQYPSPSIMSTSVHQGSDNYSVPSPYSLPFLSPMSDPATMANTSMSPMPMGPDPIIASGSPPLSHIDRTGSADIYTGYENSVLGDDLNDLYSKQTLSPYHGSPHLDDSQGVDMQQMMHFPQLTEAGPM